MLGARDHSSTAPPESVDTGPPVHTQADKPAATERPFALFCGERGALWISTCIASSGKLDPVAVEGLAGVRHALVRPGLRTVVLDLDVLGSHANALIEQVAPLARVLAIGSSGHATGAAAIEAGAIDLLPKPTDPADPGWHSRLSGVVRALSVASRLRHASPAEPVRAPVAAGASSKLVLIASGLGGYGQLARVLSQLPRTTPGVVVVHHAPDGAVSHLVQRLAARTDLGVRLLRDEDPIQPGTVSVVPQGFHAAVRTTGSTYTARVFDGPRVAGCLPSANVLLDSSARYAGLNAIGVLLDSDVDDGARGLLALRQAGGRTMCLAPGCTVFGAAARAANEIHAAQASVDLDSVASQIMRFARGAALVA